MPIRGSFGHRNLHGNEKIKDGPNSNSVGQGHGQGPHNKNAVQTITFNGVEYFAVKADGIPSDDTSLSQFHNKTVDVEGTFVGPVFVITSIVKVGP